MSAPWLEGGWVVWRTGMVDQVWSDDRLEFVIDGDYPDGSHVIVVGRDIGRAAGLCGLVDTREGRPGICGLLPSHESPHVGLVTSYAERGWRITSIQIRQPAKASA